MTDQDARDLIARLRQWENHSQAWFIAKDARAAADALDRLLRERDEAEGEADKWCGQACEAKYRAGVMERAVAEERASLRAQIIEECARVAGEAADGYRCRRAEDRRPEALAWINDERAFVADDIAKSIRSLSPPSPSTMEGEEGR